MMRPWLSALGVATILLGCSGSDSPQVGVSEPYRVANAQFVRGELPGSPPPDGGEPSEPSAASKSAPPLITAIMMTTSRVVQGQSAKKITGNASSNTNSVAIRLSDVGTGYWVIPITSLPDIANNNQVSWDATSDFDSSLEPGLHELLAVALDKKGVAGEQFSLSICVDTSVPDNLNICSPTQLPPRAVISLSWDTNADLDLQVLAPDGRVIDSKHPTSASADEAIALEDQGRIDRDSNANCAIDGLRSENLVWRKTTPVGRYGIYVHMFDACKQPSTRFRVEVYTAEPTDKNHPDTGEKLKLWYARGGELLDINANGGATRGLFVSEFIFH
jgi:hypothetical protein